MRHLLCFGLLKYSFCNIGLGLYIVEQVSLGRYLASDNTNNIGLGLYIVEQVSLGRYLASDNTNNIGLGLYIVEQGPYS